MITIEQLNKALEEVSGGDIDFILKPDLFNRGDLLDYHRNIISELGLSFWIGELFESSDSSTTLIYTWDNNYNIIVFQEGLNKFESLEEYCDWLNEMQTKSLLYNK